jgi:hypothetical protein
VSTVLRFIRLTRKAEYFGGIISSQTTNIFHTVASQHNVRNSGEGFNSRNPQFPREPREFPGRSNWIVAGRHDFGLGRLGGHVVLYQAHGIHVAVVAYRHDESGTAHPAWPDPIGSQDQSRDRADATENRER